LLRALLVRTEPRDELGAPVTDARSPLALDKGRGLAACLVKGVEDLGACLHAAALPVNFSRRVHAFPALSGAVAAPLWKGSYIKKSGRARQEKRGVVSDRADRRATMRGPRLRAAAEILFLDLFFFRIGKPAPLLAFPIS